MSETAAQRVAQSLRHDILTGRYREGDRLRSERELAEQFGVHRGAVREGLRALAQQGLVEISGAGARVGRLDHASMDVIGDLLDIDEVPDGQLVEQVLEVSTHLFSSCVSIAVERGSDADLRAICAHLDAVQDETLNPTEYLDHIHGIADGLTEASGNFVLRLIGHALKLHFWNRLETQQEVTLRLPQDFLAPLARKLNAALKARDAARATALVRELMDQHRENVIKLLTQEQARKLREPVASRLAHLFEPGHQPGSER
ncbi:MAG: FadR family transcriptional regulator [Deltaproteobacteria bacterium]|nr:FadR family transcriptional regulator [Deltaproteobacteria bacterium]MBW2393354.1 FadR family transcriptional regulator [Deltaproteobacteria bacterium]